MNFMKYKEKQDYEIMKLKKYIFLTQEGYTYQPNTHSIEPDIENLQVTGFALGSDPNDAFKSLLNENKYLLQTKFNEIFCYQLDDYFKESKRYFHLSEMRKDYPKKTE